MYTFHKTPGNNVLRNEAPLHRVTPTYSQGETEKKFIIRKSQKKVEPKTTPPKQKEQKKKLTSFQYKCP